jgi:hypothetical protein
MSGKPDSGRRHQIRVHLQHLGHPILNDSQYGTATLSLNEFQSSSTSATAPTTTTTTTTTTTAAAAATSSTFTYDPVCPTCNPARYTTDDASPSLPTCTTSKFNDEMIYLHALRYWIPREIVPQQLLQQQQPSPSAPDTISGSTDEWYIIESQCPSWACANTPL